MKLNNEQEALLRATAKINGLTIKETENMLEGMAVMIAEHEVMKARLVELEEIYDEVPARWCGSGEPIVDLKKTIKKHMEKVRGKDDDFRHDPS